jgi:4'-phosphopantetheinyl transferase
VLSEREQVALRALPADRQAEAFFSAWTSKEACLKATGEGIGESLARVEVLPGPDDAPRGLRVAGDAAAGAGWSLYGLAPAPGFVGALAVRGGRAWNVQRSAWSLSGAIGPQSPIPNNQ